MIHAYTYTEHSLNGDRTMTRRITRSDLDKVIAFHAFDGQLYTGIVQNVRRQIATIAYQIPGYGLVTTYLGKEHWNRVRFPQGDV